MSTAVIVQEQPANVAAALGAFIGAVVTLGIMSVIIGRAALEFYLIVLFPVLMGVVAGLWVRTIAGALRSRSMLLVLPLALILTAVAYGTYRYAEYFFVLEELDMTSQQLTFQEYTDLTVEIGIEITRSTSDAGFTLQDGLVWGYWGLEVVIILFIAISQAYSTRGAPSPSARDQPPPQRSSADKSDPFA